MNEIKKFLKNNEKQTLKILKRMFGIKSIAKAIEEETFLKSQIETTYSKSIEEINWTIVKQNNYTSFNGYVYAKYLTISTILEQYFENKKLYPYSNDLEDVINGY